jgi:large subunit ribosomal protein L2
MAELKTYKPTSAAMRGLVSIDRSELYKGRPYKPLTEGLTKTGGRNNNGRITTRHIGGGHKQLYRVIDFKRNKMGEAVVERIEYDPNRNAFIALINYKDGEKAYIIAPQKLAVGDKVVSGLNEDIKPGNVMPLKNMPIGTIVHNIEMKPGKGAQIARAAGCYAQLVGKDAGYAQIKLNSGELRMVLGECKAAVGAVSNPEFHNATVGKAGRSRWLGIRPTVRGEVMNPVDHPLGGRTRGNRHPCSPWGQNAKGLKTRTNKATTKYIIKSRSKAKSK